jgi:hypothetical protein
VTRRIIISEILLVHLEALCDSHQESRKAVKFHVQMRHASLSEGVRKKVNWCLPKQARVQEGAVELYWATILIFKAATFSREPSLSVIDTLK